MRVLLVGHRFPPDGVAGVERIIQSLAEQLANRGDDVSILCHRPAPGTAPEVMHERLPNGVELFRIVGGPFSLDRFDLAPDAIEAAMTRVLIETNPEVVHILHLIGLAPRFPLIVRRHRLPLVLSLQDFYFACPLAHLQTPDGQLCDGPDGGFACATTCFAPQGPSAYLRWGLRAAYFRRLLASANRIICPSRYVANYFQGFGAPPDKVVVIPNGTTDFGRARRHVQRPSNGASTGLRLAFLGAVVAHKGVHVAVQALQRARLPDVEFQVHGALPDPDYADCLTKLAAGVRGLTLRLSGPYKPTDVPKLLTNVDCLVAPSQVPESFSITVREAFACGIPVLASRLGGLGEAVREGVNGLTFTHDSPDELANLLVRVAGDAVLLAKLAGGARSSVVLSASGHADAVRSEYAVAIGREHTCLRAVEGDSAETTMFNRLLHTEVPV